MRVEPSVRSLLAGAWLVVLAPVATAQLAFGDLSGRHLPLDNDSTWDAALGDLDGDGDEDLVLANNLGQNRLYLNEGAGIFADTTGRIPADSDPSKGVALGDVDGDGDLDIVFANQSEQNRLYLNDGAAFFDDATSPVLGKSADVAMGDVDGDGDLDLVFPDFLCLNDGTGKFVAAPLFGLFFGLNGELASVALGDVDGDGDLDIVLGVDPYFITHPPAALGGQDLLLLNDGTGMFVDATVSLPRDNTWGRSLVLGDVDGDRDLDLVIGNRLYLNDGAGAFSDARASSMPPEFDRTSAVALGDVDGDGDLDLASGDGTRNRLYLNEGSGTFAPAPAGQALTDGDLSLVVLLGDVDGDGDSDFVLGGIGQNRLYLNDGSGTFADATAPVLPPDKSGHAFALGDVDGDGDSDLVLGNTVAERHRLYLNDGTGTFDDATDARLPPDQDWTHSVVLGDVDGDGDLDLVTGNSSGQDNRLYLNDGSGTFLDVTAARMVPPDAGSTRSVVLVDVDRDGDPDLVFGNDSDRNRLYLNDGMGRFADATSGRMPPDADLTRVVASGDVDGDGDPDLVFGNDSDQNRLYLNDGAGTFTDATVGRLPPDNDCTNALVLGDVDRDGDLDLVLGNSKQDCLYLNDGTGTFRDATARMPLNSHSTRALVMGDTDGDGDLDLVLGKNLARSRVYSNLLRHTHTPYLLIPGRELSIEVYARYGAPRLLDVAFVFLSTGRASVPLPPLGTIGIEPSLATQLPPFLIPQTSGVGSTSVIVPNDPNLVGLPVYAQTLLLQYPVLRLTNVTEDRIVR